MADRLRSNIVEENPIGKGLDAFRAWFNSVCEGRSISSSPDALGRLGQEGKVAQLRCGAPLTGIQISGILRFSFFPLYKAFQRQASSFRKQAVATSETIS